MDRIETHRKIFSAAVVSAQLGQPGQASAVAYDTPTQQAIRRSFRQKHDAVTAVFKAADNLVAAARHMSTMDRLNRTLEAMRACLPPVTHVKSFAPPSGTAPVRTSRDWSK